jgi:AraC-like DNA-binding protein
MNLLEILSLITVFQLLQLSVVLFVFKKGSRVSNRILATFMLFNALLIFFFNYGFRIGSGPGLDSFFYFLLAPYIYQYIRSLCRINYQRSWKEFLHWIPAVIVLLASRFNQINYSLILIVLDVQIAIYLVLSFKTIYTYRRNVQNQYSSMNHVDLSWLLLIIVAFGIMVSVDLITFILDQLIQISEAATQTLSIVSISINLFFATSIVIIGLRHQNVLSGIKDPPKYAGSGFSDSKIKEYTEVVSQAMKQDKLFLNPELNIRDLAEKVELHPKLLSQVINKGFGRNFFDFVNSYRVTEAKEIMLSEPQKTILEVLYEVGYNSKSAFNKAFKINTGQTPSEFRKNLKKA